MIRINDVVDNFGISSRTLRYYEEVGLLWSSHPDNKTQRYYDETSLERLKQIIILRKLQIPIKDIIEIFKSESTAALIQSFVDKLESLDMEITALSNLRRLVDDFLHKMLMKGIKKISTITLLYEETEKRLATIEKDDEITFERFEKTSREALKLHDVRITRLPSVRVLTSRLKTGRIVWQNDMQNLFAAYGFMSNPGYRDCFFRKEPNDEWTKLLIIPDDYDNITEYEDEDFTGGLFAVASSFMDNMNDIFILLNDWIYKSDFYELDTDVEGKLRCREMIEEILPWDIVDRFGRYQQDLFIPIRIKTEKEPK
ncbi:MAG: MerR family transcriptional regulator [Eubacteriales bacterium]